MTTTNGDPTTDKPTDQALAVRPPSQALIRQDAMNTALRGLIPTTYGEAMELSRFLIRSEVVPKSLQPKVAATAADIEKKVATCFSIILSGMELGLTPLRALKQITVIGGTMAMAADLQLAVVKRDGLLAFHDEGFEIAGTTDTDLAPVKAAKVGDPDTPGRTRDGARVLQLVKHLVPGRYYGWCTMGRRGDLDDKGAQVIHTRVFTQDDADRVTMEVWDNDSDERGKKKTIRLSDKENYKNWPQDMYPKRARTRLEGFLFGDSLGGIPAVEAMDGATVIDAEVLPAGGGDQAGGGSGMDVGDYLAQIRLADAVLADGIEAGFTHLRLGHAKQLQLLVQHKDDPTALLSWLRAEAEQRKGVPEDKRRGSKQKKDEPAKPAAPAAGAAPVVAPAAQVAAAPAPAAPAAADQPAAPVASELPPVDKPLPPGAVRWNKAGKPVDAKGRIVKQPPQQPAAAVEPQQVRDTATADAVAQQVLATHAPTPPAPTAPGSGLADKLKKMQDSGLKDTASF